MATFVVFYTGQFRFVECINLHTDVIAQNSGIYAGLSTTINESWKMTLSARHSVNPLKTLEESLTEFKNKNFINCAIIDNSFYCVVPEYESVEFFPCEYFFTLGTTIQEINSDYVAVMTTDLIFKNIKAEFLNNIVENLISNKKPTAYVRYADWNKKNQMITYLFFLNKEAVLAIKQHYIDAIKTFLTECHEFRLSNEYATLRLLELCNIAITGLPYQSETAILRFTPAIPFDKIDILTASMISSLNTDYRVWRGKEVAERRKINSNLV